MTHTSPYQVHGPPVRTQIDKHLHPLTDGYREGMQPTSTHAEIDAITLCFPILLLEGGPDRLSSYFPNPQSPRLMIYSGWCRGCLRVFNSKELPDGKPAGPALGVGAERTPSCIKVRGVSISRPSPRRRRFTGRCLKSNFPS